MKFMRIFPLVFVTGLALAGPEAQPEEKRQGTYCVRVGSLY